MSKRALIVSISVAMAWLLGACSVHRVDKQSAVPSFEIQPGFVENETEQREGSEWGRSWWETFEDPILTAFVEDGLESNFELKGIALRITQANERLRQAGAPLYPSLELEAGYGVEWDGDRDAVSNRDRENSKDVGVLLQWEVDLLGRLSSARKASGFERAATVQDWLDARLLFSSTLVEIYFEMKEQRRQLEVLEAQIEINESLLKLTTLRYGQGQSSIVDVLQQREQLDATKARVPESEARIGQLQYEFDALLGIIPGSGSPILDSSLADLPPLPEVGVPIRLLQQRPDLRAAHDRILALDYRVGVAVAEQFPTLRIGGGINWSGDPSFGDSVSSLFAGLVTPLFSGGELRSEVRLRRANLEEALAYYSDGFLTALAEVESALLLERKLSERLVLVERQLVTARRLLSEARSRFSQGITDYLPVFTSLTIVQNLERDIVSARRNVLSSRVGLHRALGGPILNPDSYAQRIQTNE